MVSFDVTSLYTNVPQEHTLTVIQNRLETKQNWQNETKLEIEDVMTLLKLCLKGTYFQFRGGMYRQVDGVPMGSPISPIFADIFLQDLESTIIPQNPSIDFWKRFSDDTFSLINQRKVTEVLHKLNQFHPSIQFTCETETNETLQFLDTEVHRNDDFTFSHRVYRKPTHTDRYLHYSSYHHKSQKISVIDSLAYRAYRICDSESIKTELEYITKVLRRNGYPTLLIRKRTQIMEQKTNQPNNNAPTQDDTQRFILPYSGQMITGRFTHFLRRKTNLKFGYTPGVKLRQLLSTHKDKRPSTTSGIYRLPCGNCTATYIGQTGRNIGQRMKEHERDIRNNKDTSAVAQHINDNRSHLMDFSKAELIHKEPHYFARIFKEGLYINKETTAMNGTDGLRINPIWTTALLPLLSRN
jgi:hypothetical protein